jgi:cytochrome c-type biogenesis protein CcmH/NrfG
MGLLMKLLTVPVSGPLAGLMFIGEKLAEAADKEAFDPDAIKRQLVALEKQLDAGLISEEVFEEAELVLLQQLRATMLERSGT